MSVWDILESLNLTVEESQALAQVRDATTKAEAALNKTAQELQSIWGEEEGDDPDLLDALAALRSLN